MLATYGAKYRSLKAPRTLQWKPNLGSVQLELLQRRKGTEGGGRSGAQAAAAAVPSNSTSSSLSR